MTEQTRLDPQHIMNLEPGPELNAHITEWFDALKLDNVDTKQAWSNNPFARFTLMELIGDHIGSFGIMVYQDAPPIISEMATIGEEYDCVMVFTDDWNESLAKAMLLYVNDHRGDFMHPKFQAAMDAAPKRPEVLQ